MGCQDLPCKTATVTRLRRLDFSLPGALVGDRVYGLMVFAQRTRVRALRR